MIENKNALKLTMWWGGWWWWWGERIKVVRNRVYPRAAADDKNEIFACSIVKLMVLRSYDKLLINRFEWDHQFAWEGPVHG